MRKTFILLIIIVSTLFIGCETGRTNSETGTWNSEDATMQIKIKRGGTYIITRETDSFKGEYKGKWKTTTQLEESTNKEYFLYTFTDDAGITFKGKLYFYDDETLYLTEMKGFGFGYDTLNLY